MNQQAARDAELAAKRAFVDWLKLQRDRDDRVGAVARGVDEAIAEFSLSGFYVPPDSVVREEFDGSPLWRAPRKARPWKAIAV